MREAQIVVYKENEPDSEPEVFVHKSPQDCIFGIDLEDVTDAQAIVFYSMKYQPEEEPQSDSESEFEIDDSESVDPSGDFESEYVKYKGKMENSAKEFDPEKNDFMFDEATEEMGLDTSYVPMRTVQWTKEDEIQTSGHEVESVQCTLEKHPRTWARSEVRIHASELSEIVAFYNACRS